MLYPARGPRKPKSRGRDAQLTGSTQTEREGAKPRAGAGWLPWRLAGAIPPAILILLALLQAYRGTFDPLLVSDKRAGFGMFSTVDRLNTRNFRAYGLGEGRIEPIVPNNRLFETIHRAGSHPRESVIRDIAGELAGRQAEEWMHSLRAEYWKLEFDGETRTCGRVLLNSATVELAHGTR